MKNITDQLADSTTKTARKETLRAALKIGKATAKYAGKYGIKLAGVVFLVILDALWVDNLNEDEMDMRQSTFFG